ncbi:hypothetical protein [Niveibacterium sp. SC-1]|uniref:hypothetical protein n=1 Tax=Niveibacterium sp. SC-1 TaxID=3135646 RepID=UPI00311FCAF6
MVREEGVANPPRVLGCLLLALGLALAVGGLHLKMNLGGDGSYFAVVGGLVALAGFLAFSGRSAAVLVYGLTLLVVWGWSLQEVGANPPELLPRVGLPTLIGLYLFSGKVRARLN